MQSRNYCFGIALGEGRPPDLASTGGKLAEGFFTAPVLVEMAQTHAVEMPIASAVADILARRTSVDEAIEKLLARPLRAEGK